MNAREPLRHHEGTLPSAVRARVADEAGTTTGWEECVGVDSAVVGTIGFGVGVPIEILYKQSGMTSERVAEVASARNLLERESGGA